MASPIILICRTRSERVWLHVNPIQIVCDQTYLLRTAQHVEFLESEHEDGVRDLVPAEGPHLGGTIHGQSREHGVVPEQIKLCR